MTDLCNNAIRTLLLLALSASLAAAQESSSLSLQSSRASDETPDAPLPTGINSTVTPAPATNTPLFPSATQSFPPSGGPGDLARPQPAGKDGMSFGAGGGSNMGGPGGGMSGPGGGRGGPQGSGAAPSAMGGGTGGMQPGGSAPISSVLNLNTLFQLTGAMGRNVSQAHPLLGSALNALPRLNQLAQGGLNFSLGSGGAGMNSGMGGMRGGPGGGMGMGPQGGNAFNPSLSTSGQFRRNRFDFSATAAVRAGGQGAFLGTGQSGGMSAGISSFSSKMYVPAGMGTKPTQVMGGPPGTSGSSKQPTTSVTLRLSF